MKYTTEMDSDTTSQILSFLKIGLAIQHLIEEALQTAWTSHMPTSIV